MWKIARIFTFFSSLLGAIYEGTSNIQLSTIAKNMKEFEPWQWMILVFPFYLLKQGQLWKLILWENPAKSMSPSYMWKIVKFKIKEQICYESSINNNDDNDYFIYV